MTKGRHNICHVCKTASMSMLTFLKHVISQDFYKNFPLPQKDLERREVAIKERNKFACIVSKPLVSCLWGCGESVNPQKLNIQEVQWGFVL